MPSIALPSSETSVIIHAPAAPRPNKPTGPRTPEGKARSSQNARKHGLSIALAPPDLAADADYCIRKNELEEEWQPNTPTQCYLVDELALTAWKLAQIPALERALLATPLGDKTPADPTALPQPATHRDDPTVQLTAHHLLPNQPTPLTRLWDHHRRLQARFQSIIRQLIRLQNPPKRQPTAFELDAARQLRRDHDELECMSNTLHERNRRRTLDDAREYPVDKTPRPAGYDHEADYFGPPPAPTEPPAPCNTAQHGATSDAPAQNEPPSVSSLSSVAEPLPPAQNELPSSSSCPSCPSWFNPQPQNEPDRYTALPTEETHA